MKVWAIAAQKGGVGKTTTTVSVAGCLAADGARVLLVDLDPHGSLTGYFGWDSDALDDTVLNVFEAAADGVALASIAPFLRPTGVANLTLLPSSTALVTLERRHGLKPGLGLALKQALASVAERFDYCLLDCPPTLGLLVVNALVAAEKLIHPVQTEPLAAAAVDRMLWTLAMIERARGVALPSLVVPTMFDRRTRAAVTTLDALRRRSDIQLWDDVIPIDTQFREASRLRQPLPTWLPQARGAQAYFRLLGALQGARTATLRAVG